MCCYLQFVVSDTCLTYPFLKVAMSNVHFRPPATINLHHFPLSQMIKSYVSKVEDNMPELLQSSPFHPTLSNLLSQWIPRVFQNHPSTYAFDMVFCFLTLFHKPLLSSMFLLPLKTCSDFLHLKKNPTKPFILLSSYKTTALRFPSSSAP